MVPVSSATRNSSSLRVLYPLCSLLSQYAPRLFHGVPNAPSNPSQVFGNTHVLAKRASEFDPHKPKFVAFAVLIPILVLLSGLFAGLTLGYMSLDETQLNVLSISGTPKQKEYANKIKPIRKNGHLLLVTLLLANMIVNESLPVLADPVLGGGFQSVVVSTVLIVIFAEIIPQSLFTRHGLYLGAKMAGFTRVLIYIMGVVAWPVAKLLEFVLGKHHGIIYRRAELKELIAMHSSVGIHGGDLKTDTVTIIGATLDLQEKVVKQAMTPISDVFMLSIDSKLDYDLLKKIVQTGHSRVPVYEEVEVPASVADAVQILEFPGVVPKTDGNKVHKVKKIVGILLVKQCVLLDPKDATPLRKIPLNKVPFVPNNEPLLGILDKFQEGRSHMAIVSRFSVEKAASVKKAVKRGLTKRLMERVGMGDDTDTDSDHDEEEPESSSSGDGEGTDDDKTLASRKKKRGIVKKLSSKRSKKHGARDIEEGAGQGGTVGAFSKKQEVHPGVLEMDFATAGGEKEKIDSGVAVGGGLRKGDVLDGVRKSSLDDGKRVKTTSFQLPRVAAGMTSMSMLEQNMPADAVLAKKGAEEFLQGFDPAVMPLGIITLEDILEELIGEEIYDEFDRQGANGDPYQVPPPVLAQQDQASGSLAPGPANSAQQTVVPIAPTPTHGYRHGLFKPISLKGLGFLRSRSAPPSPRDNTSIDLSEDEDTETIDEKDGSFAHETVEAGNPLSLDVGLSVDTDHGAHGFHRTNSDTMMVMRNPVHGDQSRDAAAFLPTSSMRQEVIGRGRQPPSIIMERENSSSSNGSGPASDSKSVEKPRDIDDVQVIVEDTERGLATPVHIPGPHEHNAAPIQVAAPSPLKQRTLPPANIGTNVHSNLIIGNTSRSASPARSLEAVLLERKRRIVGMMASSGTSQVVPGGVGFTGIQIPTTTTGISASAPVSAAGSSSSLSPAVDVSVGAIKDATVVTARSGGTISGKRNRFKSSPLGAEKPQTGALLVRNASESNRVDKDAEEYLDDKKLEGRD